MRTCCIMIFAARAKAYVKVCKKEVVNKKGNTLKAYSGVCCSSITWHGWCWERRHWMVGCMTDSSELLLEGHVFSCKLAYQPVQLLVLHGKLRVACLNLGCLHLFALATEVGTLPVSLHADLWASKMAKTRQK